MLATGSSRTNRVFLAVLALSAVLNLYLMYVLPGAETVPFHLVWIGLSIMYGLSMWRLTTMAVVLVIVAVDHGYVLVHHADMGVIGWEETTEVPLMTAVFVVMVWHVRRRQVMMAEVARLAEGDRRRAEAQERFIRLVSHELRTPITIARGFTELVRNASTDETVKDDTRIVMEELDRMAGIVQRLVTLMQMDGSYERTSSDVDRVLARVVLRWRPAADRRWTVRSTIGEAPINQDRLEAALDSLVENAVKFTAPGDRIDVIGNGGPETWSITVADSGKGIPPERLAALTADIPAAVSVATTSGTGLGLAIVRAVAASWGGRVDIDSELGVGTTVTLHFARSAADQAGADGVSGPYRATTPMGA